MKFEQLLSWVIVYQKYNFIKFNIIKKIKKITNYTNIKINHFYLNILNFNTLRCAKFVYFVILIFIKNKKIYNYKINDKLVKTLFMFFIFIILNYKKNVNKLLLKHFKKLNIFNFWFFFFTYLNTLIKVHDYTNVYNLKFKNYINKCYFFIKKNCIVVLLKYFIKLYEKNIFYVYTVTINKNFNPYRIIFNEKILYIIKFKRNYFKTIILLFQANNKVSIFLTKQIIFYKNLFIVQTNYKITKKIINLFSKSKIITTKELNGFDYRKFFKFL